MQPVNQTKLREIFVTILELDDTDDPTVVSKASAERWDSLAQTSLVAAIESEFNLTLQIAEMDRITSFAATKVLLEEKGL
jgi:acyl carrier protein